MSCFRNFVGSSSHKTHVMLQVYNSIQNKKVGYRIRCLYLRQHLPTNWKPDSK